MEFRLKVSRIPTSELVYLQLVGKRCGNMYLVEQKKMINLLQLPEDAYSLVKLEKKLETSFQLRRVLTSPASQSS